MFRIPRISISIANIIVLTLLSYNLLPVHGFVPLSQTGLSNIAVSSTTLLIKLKEEGRIQKSKRNEGSYLNRRKAFTHAMGIGSALLGCQDSAFGAKFPDMDVNNALAREYTAFPGLYPTIATKIVNGAKKSPYSSKKEVYSILSSDVEKARLQEYDSSIKILPVDKALQQFKASQICKYECGNRVSSSYRDDQIREVQAARSVTESKPANEQKLGTLLNIDL